MPTAKSQADLSLHWAHMPFCWFCHVAAHFNIRQDLKTFLTYQFIMQLCARLILMLGKTG